MRTPIWKPSKAFIENSNLHDYMKWVNEQLGYSFSDYQSLWEWSVTEVDVFWQTIIAYFDVLHDGQATSVTSGAAMPDIQWFTGIQLSYAEHIFRKATDKQHAIIFKKEGDATIQTIEWTELTATTLRVQTFLKRTSLQPGDRVAAFIATSPEATAAFLACNSLGAVWSSCSPDFGVSSVLDRFQQIAPTVLFAVDGYAYGGKFFDKNETIAALIEQLPTLKKIVIVHHPKSKLLDTQNQIKIIYWHQLPEPRDTVLSFTRVPFSHPIWILFSSGTTGLPKAITHSVGGILLEHLKYGAFHNNYKTGDRCFWYTTTGWMMWNYIHGALLAGSTLVLYDGSPAYPTISTLWQFIQDAKITHFGTSAGFILACMKAKLIPRLAFDLTSLQSIGSTGSTLPPEGFEWVYNAVGKDIWLTSMSGGTDVCSAFVGGNPLVPVYSGEIQCRALGSSVKAFDDEGKEVENEVGEMVITQPMPSMPIYFWDDPSKARYHESYFEHFQGVWRHGDWIKITPHNGVVIYGRSDATLNRGGIRIGTSEIYRAVDTVPEVRDSVIICVEKNEGEFWMPLFVQLHEGYQLTEGIIKQLKKAIRSAYTPRHVPDEILAVPSIPYTISGKKTETPVKKIMMGKPAEQVVNAGALRNPEALDFFVALYKERKK